MVAPTGETRYSTHMAAVGGDDVEVCFFSWRHALFGRYDIFHLHWPEVFVGRGGGRKARMLWLRAQALLIRLWLTRTPVVRTLHNIEPHDSKGTLSGNGTIRRFEKLTQYEIHLVPEPDRDTALPTMLIPHGSYREPFGRLPRGERRPGRITFFGLVRPYKGVDLLVRLFRGIDRQDLSLRIVGRPLDHELAKQITDAAEEDVRISHRLEFVPDADLVKEITSSELTVLPYRELHSSGAALVALSLDTPILVPDTTTTRALREEVGDHWVHLFSPPLKADVLLTALERVRREEDPPPPRLEARDWERVRAAHLAVYRHVLGGGNDNQDVKSSDMKGSARGD